VSLNIRVHPFNIRNNINIKHLALYGIFTLGIGTHAVLLAEAPLSNKFKWKIACFEMFITEI
jgi:hypothetical protein